MVNSTQHPLSPLPVGDEAKLMTNHGAVAVQFSVLLTLNPPLRSDEDRVVPVQPGIIGSHKAEGRSIVAERLRGPACIALPSVSRPGRGTRITPFPVRVVRCSAVNGLRPSQSTVHPDLVPVWDR